MPILRPGGPISKSHRRFDRVVAAVFAAAGIALGLWNAHQCASLTSGYVAVYNYVFAVVAAGGACIAGLLLLIYWRTRWAGIGIIALGVLSCATFYGAMAVLLKYDRAAWLHEPLVRIGPDQKASAVVYFQKGVSSGDIEAFAYSVLKNDAKPLLHGRDYPNFVSSYLRLAPSQANGFDACALTFFAGARPEEVNAYLGKIGADKRVARIFLNVAPDAIRLDPQAVPGDRSAMPKRPHTR